MGLNPFSPVIMPEHVMVLKVDSVRTSSNVSSDVRTSSVATSIAFHDQSYDDDDVFLSGDNLVSTPIRAEVSAIYKMMRSRTYPE